MRQLKHDTAMNREIQHWVILSDMHVPYEDVESLAAVEKYLAAHRVDGLLNIGDFMDMDAISSFNFGKPRKTENKRLSVDFDRANKILDRQQSIIRKRNPNAKFVMLEGNHEERIERFLDQHPMLEGLLDVPKLLRLNERHITWVRSWSDGKVHTIGKANFVHGLYTNMYHAKKMVDAWGTNIFYGHTHDIMAISRTHKGKSDIVVGQSIGCLCVYEQAYMKGKPSNWQQGFGIFFFLPDGNYTYYIPRIFNHRFVGPDGVLYEP